MWKQKDRLLERLMAGTKGAAVEIVRRGYIFKIEPMELAAEYVNHEK